MVQATLTHVLHLGWYKALRAIPFCKLEVRVWAGVSQSGALTSAANLDPPLRSVEAGEGP